MKDIIHHPVGKPIIAWSDNRLTVTLIDPQQQKVLCEYQIRTHHNGRELLIPEIALPEVNEAQAVTDAGFIAFPLLYTRGQERAPGDLFDNLRRKNEMT